MSLSHFHMNDKQIKNASSATLTAAMETVAKRYQGLNEPTQKFIDEVQELIPDAGGVQTGAARFNWQGKRGESLLRIIYLASLFNLDLDTLANAENFSRLSGILRSVEAHTPNGRKNISNRLSFDGKTLTYNMEVFAMVNYYNALRKERDHKLNLERNKKATDLTDEYQVISTKMRQGIALPSDIKRLVTVSQLIDSLPIEMFQPVTKAVN
ncbi:hypothetical protein [Aliivibrio fischeri]|uniref:hypothetical protein n=1 Tax=Aliivibrio fischeri TaxID=668 RepID=UPI0010600243|nr:hypothetical protein [Aliivibrio fischeri]TDM54302.1 hypothetical protein VFFQA001_06930 [Aliivibrio fischeri]